MDLSASTTLPTFDRSPLRKDFTTTRLKVEGPFENDRNFVYADLYKAIIREVYGVKDVIIGHHLVYEVSEKRSDGFTYTFVQEVPSADALIFDHGVMKALFGDDYLAALSNLAVEPTKTRDDLLARFFYGRTTVNRSHNIAES